MTTSLLDTATKSSAAALRRWGEVLPDPQDVDFAQAFDRFGEAKVVLLGEATHGTAEFYRARAAITKHLIAHHGFTIVALEADWPDAARLDRYVRHKAQRPSPGPAFNRFPRWMWRNAQFRDFLDWLHGHNKDRPEGARAAIRGLDLYSLRDSVAAVLAYLRVAAPAEAKAAAARYACLTPWQADPAAYGRAVLYGADPCEDEAVAQLKAMLALRLEDVRHDGDDLFDAAQNARVVQAAEHYYRIMYRGSRESWNLRDRHMFDTLKRVLAAGGPQAKAVVWAHNSHIGDASATQMGWEGEFNIGELAKGAFGDAAVAIGFGTDFGTVAAAPDWDEPVEIMAVRPARSDSYEFLFKHAGYARSLTDWWRKRRPELKDLLAQPRLERAIGVVYRPDTELHSHYFRAILSDQFDAFVWFAKTEAVTPLATEGGPAGPPETYPFGV